MSSPIICPKPYTTSNDDGAIPCGITYAEAIGYKNYQILRILAMSFCFPLLIITIIQCIRLIYYRGIRPIVQIHGMYAFMLASVASQAIRSVDPQGWSLTLHPIASQLLNDVSTCSILCTAFLVAMSWLKLMRQIAGKKESKIYQVAEWGMPCGLVIIVFTLCILQTQVHNPGTYVFTMAKYCVFVLFILSFTITLWTQGIPLFIALNQSNGVSGSSIPSSPKPDRDRDRDASKLAASPSSPHKTLQSQPSCTALASDANLVRQASAVPVTVAVTQASPNQVNIEMMDMESTTCGTGEERSSVTTNDTTTNATHSPQPSIIPEHIQPVRTSIIAHHTSNPASASSAAAHTSSPSMGYTTRKLSTPSASASAASRAPVHMIIPTPIPAPATAPASSSHASTGKKKAKMTRILKLIVAASCVSLATVGFQISRIVTDYRSKFDDRDRPKAVPVGTFGSIFPHLLLGILEYLACIVILTFFRQMKGDGTRGYSDTPRKQSKQTTNTHTRTVEG